MMSPRSKRISDLFLGALKCPPAERAAFLAQACAGDDKLLGEVESLLATEEQAASLLDLW